MSALGSTGLLLPQVPAFAMAADNELLTLSDKLVHEWGAQLLALQVNNPSLKGLHGGILCPSCAVVHGRCGDAIFPLLYLADKTGDKKYVDGALRLYDWMEETVSTSDGAWINEVSVSNWKGITVFTSIALAESLIHFGHLLSKATIAAWKARLQKAGDYIYKTFSINFGNINYPVTASYALCLLGKYLEQPHFTEKGKTLAHESLASFTPKDNLLYGEGKPVPLKSAKGCYAVDLGYNVEESLPSLVLYGKLMNDTKVLDVVTQSMKSHLEFMLPDGAWDNSWGTRNFKWTWWGSRTSDGCQPAFGLMADREPAFYKAALQNTRLLAQCTHNHLLHGGPHYVQHGIRPCVNHSLAHSKALVTILLHAKEVKASTARLPRESAYGVKAFPDIYTWLIAKNKWRGTVTGYDQEYVMKSGHATGGALSLLWHEQAGTILVASMNKYQLLEGFNMQQDKDASTMCLTPRFEVDNFRNINDLKATVEQTQTAAGIVFKAQSSLVDENQLPAPVTDCETTYTFSDDAVLIHATTKNEKASFFLPVITTIDEKVSVLADNKLEIHKKGGVVRIESSAPMKMIGGVQERIFNFVPGMEALPLQFEASDVQIKITVV
jgi:hypothetical protein